MDILDHHRKVWNEKPLIRKIYSKWYKMIIAALSPLSGDTVEIGAGTGNLKEFKPDIIATDIDPKPWLDMNFDAHHMPFADATLANIVMIDVLHHLADPVHFLHEAWRALKPGGRLLFLEPYPSAFSKIVYKRFHPEPFIFDINYYDPNVVKAHEKHPWDSNQAIPYLLFFKHADEFQLNFAQIYTVKRKTLLSFLTYPLSGGFENKQKYPTWTYPVFEFAELLLWPFGKWLAFRCFVVLEKVS